MNKIISRDLIAAGMIFVVLMISNLALGLIDYSVPMPENYGNVSNIEQFTELTRQLDTRDTIIMYLAFLVGVVASIIIFYLLKLWRKKA